MSMSKGKNLSEYEKRFIEMNRETLTGSQIGRYLGRTKYTIYAHIRRNKISCNPGIKGRRISDEEISNRVINVPAKPEHKRPPAVYTNSRSPFGIADELHRGSRQFVTY